ncbi:hypothetical protein PMIN06_001915 [Paraphaeosphaeria minitans]
MTPALQLLDTRIPSPPRVSFSAQQTEYCSQIARYDPRYAVSWETPIFKFFRHLTLKYAPGFAVTFADSRVIGVTRKDIPHIEMKYFSKWLHSCCEVDYRLVVRHRIGA